MVVRTLKHGAFLALVAVAFLVQPLVVSRGAFVIETGPACCCPDPTKCPCHDHGNHEPGPGAKVRKCGLDGTLVTPAAFVAVAEVERPDVPSPQRAFDAPLRHRELPPADRPTRPVTPPF